MGGAPHPGTDGGRASFELERLEQADGRLLVSGWWEGVRGMRFVRPALVVDGRQVLATLEHKPWAAHGEGAWRAAFPWKDDAELDPGLVMLVVAPTVEVPLDRRAAPPEAVENGVAGSSNGDDRSAGYAADVPSLPEPEPVVAEPHGRGATSVREPLPAASAARARDDDGEPVGEELRVTRMTRGAGREPGAEPASAAANGGPPSDAADAPHDDLQQLERLLGALRAELDEARAALAQRDARCHELEQQAGRERAAAGEAGSQRDEVLRAHAIAVRDRDRAIEQLEEAILDREAAVRTRTRMEAQRDEAIEQRERAEARRDEARDQRNEARKQRDDVLIAHRALQKQHKSGLAQADRRGPVVEPEDAPAPERDDAAEEELAALPYADELDADDDDTAAVAPALPGDDDTQPLAPLFDDEDRARAERRDERAREPAPVDADGRETPIGVRVIPAARTVAAHVHRAERVREHNVTKWDLWAIRVLGTVAAVSFITLLVMILKAFFVL